MAASPSSPSLGDDTRGVGQRPALEPGIASLASSVSSSGKVGESMRFDGGGRTGAGHDPQVDEEDRSRLELRAGRELDAHAVGAAARCRRAARSRGCLVAGGARCAGGGEPRISSALAPDSAIESSRSSPSCLPPAASSPARQSSIAASRWLEAQSRQAAHQPRADEAGLGRDARGRAARSRSSPAPWSDG